MSEKIEPALTPEEWKKRRKRLDEWSAIVFDSEVVVEGPDPQEAVSLARSDHIAALIAAANATLPSGDPRKITREWVEWLRECGSHGHIADVLESYLPPP